MDDKGGFPYEPSFLFFPYSSFCILHSAFNPKGYLMFWFKGKSKFNPEKVKKAAKKACFKNLGHAGAAIRLTARRSIRKSKTASLRDTPPHTRRGQLKRGILYAVDKNKGSVIVGSAYTIVGQSGKAHEFGGKYKKQNYPRRRFMGPALEKNESKLPKMWKDSIK